MRYQPIVPTRRTQPFDDPAWAFELKLDGFRCIADTIELRLISKQRNRMKRFERLLDSLPLGYVFDGEIVCLDETAVSGTRAGLCAFRRPERRGR